MAGQRSFQRLSPNVRLLGAILLIQMMLLSFPMNHLIKPRQAMGPQPGDDCSYLQLFTLTLLPRWQSSPPLASLWTEQLMCLHLFLFSCYLNKFLCPALALQILLSLMETRNWATFGKLRWSAANIPGASIEKVQQQHRLEHLKEKSYLDPHFEQIFYIQGVRREHK